MKNDMYELPESLYEFAQISDFHGVIEDLAAMAEDEDWNYHNTASASNLPILENYIRNTYIRLSREKFQYQIPDFIGIIPECLA